MKTVLSIPKTKLFTASGDFGKATFVRIDESKNEGMNAFCMSSNNIHNQTGVNYFIQHDNKVIPV